MSDETGDAEFEASLANLPVDGNGDGDGGGALPASDDGTLASRIDSIQGTLSTLGMRVDALVTSTTTYRSALTDRLADYADLVTKSARNQAADLEEYRRTTERTVAEVRRSLTGSEEAIANLGDRLAALDTGPADDSEARRVIAEIRSILDAQDRLSGFLTESLDRFGDVVLERVDASQRGVLEQVAALREVVISTAPADPAEALGGELGAIRAAVEDLAARDVAAGLRDDLAGVRSLAAAAADRDPGPALAELRSVLDDVAGRDPVAALRDELTDLRDLLVAAQAADPAGAVSAELAPVRTSLDSTLDRLATLAASIHALDARIEALTGADRSEEVLARLTELTGADRTDEVLTRIAELAATDRSAEVLARVEGLAGADRSEEVLARIGEVVASDRSEEVLARIGELAEADRSEELLARLKELASAERTVEMLARISEMIGPDRTDEILAGIDAVAGADRTDEILARIDGVAATERTDEVLARIGELTALDRSGDVLARLQGLDDVATGSQVRSVGADVRAHLVDALAEVDLPGIRQVLAGFDPASLAEEVRAVGSAVADDGSAVRGMLDQVTTRLDGLTSRVAENPVDRTDEVLARLDEVGNRLAGSPVDRTDEVLARLDAVATHLADPPADLPPDRTDEVLARFDDVATAGQVTALGAQVGATVADALAGFDADGMSTGIDAIRSVVDADSSAVRAALDELSETMQDLASGQVVGALWDEFRALRESVDRLSAKTNQIAQASQAPAAGPVDDDAGSAVDGAALDELRTELDAIRASIDALAEDRSAITAAGAVRDEVASLRGAIQEIDLTPTPDVGATALRDAVLELTDEVRALLDAAEIEGGADDGGWAAEADAAGGGTDRGSDDGDPGDEGEDLLATVADQLEALREELHEGLAVEPSEELIETLASLRSELEAARAGFGSSGGVLDAIADLRASVEAVQARLEEGLVLADDPTPAGGEVVATLDPDAIDLLRAEIRDGLAAAGADPGATASGASSEQDMVMLRDEIRAAGGVSDEVVDALRKELKALRRRIAVKAQEKVLSDEQLAEIAEAVAARLGKD